MLTFYVVKKLVTAVLLGCYLCDRNVEVIHWRKRLVELDDGTTVSIIRKLNRWKLSAPLLPTEQELSSSKGRVSPKIYCADQTAVKPVTKTWVPVKTER